MSRYVPVKCLCGHPHRGACRRSCGCTVFRRAAAALPVKAPRVIRGTVMVQPKGIAS